MICNVLEKISNDLCAEKNHNKFPSQGANTLTNARTVTETVSGPGWSSHLCGMPVERTGITGNLWAPPWMGREQDITPVTGNAVAMPCIFQVKLQKSPLSG